MLSGRLGSGRHKSPGSGITWQKEARLIEAHRVKDKLHFPWNPWSASQGTGAMLSYLDFTRQGGQGSEKPGRAGPRLLRPQTQC